MGDDREYSARHWRLFHEREPELATKLGNLFRLQDASLDSSEPYGASISHFNQPSSHPKYPGRRNQPEWWGKLTLGNKLATHFGISLRVALIIHLEDRMSNAFLADIQRFLRNEDLDKDLLVLVAPATFARRVAANSPRPIIQLLTDDLDASPPPLGLRDSFYATLGAANHFSYSKVLKNEDDFYGREDLLATVTRLLTREHDNVGLYGLRKSGKSSILQMIRLRLRRQGRPCAMIDLSGLLSANPDRLRAEIANKLNDALHVVTETRTVDRSVNKTKRRAHKELGLAELRDIAADTLAQSEHPIVLLIDETDLCLERTSAHHPGNRAYLDEDATRRLDRLSVLFEMRGLSQELDDGELLFVFAGVSHALTESSTLFGNENYLFRFARTVPLQPMDREDVAKLVRGLGKRSGVSFRDRATIDRLHWAYGGHPFLTRTACSLIADSPERRRSEDVPFEVAPTLVDEAIYDTSDAGPRAAVAQVLESFGLYEPDALNDLLRFAHGELDGLSPGVSLLGDRYGFLDSSGQLILNSIGLIDATDLKALDPN